MRKPSEIILKNGKTLEQVLEEHSHWLNEDCDGWENMRAVLRSADLSSANLLSADLSFADLSSADLSSADLRSADLSSADLSSANLSYANLRSADLRSADLSYAVLSSANLSSANLRSADLRSANLLSADLSFADLSSADLRSADLSSANLSYANLRSADLRSADLSYAVLSSANFDNKEKVRKGIKLTEPMIGWKKCKYNVIVKLEIPIGAIVFSINNNKCRTDKAIVKEIIGANRAYSRHKFFSYYVGDVIEVFNFNCEYNVECAAGIHFFRTREEAENY